MAGVPQRWNFAAIEALALEIHGYSGTVHGLLDEGSAGLARIVAEWHGDGAEAYQALQVKWNNASMELNAALQNLGQTIQEAGTTMLHAEMAVKGSFGT
ncbi:WXG100 family type VII secretion target [Mycolicibacterium sp. P9-64]|uniref:WXG100 family type VII secretion target n=1 Tax=Mycolicibacterium sp. P9-64 TaxID=2024612 RepID=UPI0011EC53EC|nr:WXG100 family type VII secretion target [Mycolicibacterium sp. P9-64]KAA0079695.1 WXG100 family type VII secretion target [Mycolicibacterium sp. P9-64]